MRAGQILSSFDRSRVDELARQLGVETAGKKEEVVPRIADALAHRKDASGKQLGADGALRALFPLLTRADLLKVFGELHWTGESAEYVPYPGLGRVNEFELRDLFLALCNAEQNKEAAEIDSLCSSDRFGDVFRTPSNANAAIASIARTTPPPPVATVVPLRLVEPDPQNEERKAARLRERVSALFAKLSKLPAPEKEPLPELPAELSLLGWWQFDLPKQRWFLPALAGDNLNARMGELLVCLHTRQPLPSLWRSPLELVPEPMFKSFARAAFAGNALARYLPLGAATTPELIELLEALQNPQPFVETKFAPPETPSSYDWLKLAERILRGESEDTVLLAIPEGEVSLTRDEHQKLRAAWDHFHLVLQANPDAAAVQLFVGLVSRMPGVSEISSEKIDAVLMPAARAQSFPERLELPKKVPTLKEARAQLRQVATEKRKDAAGKLHKAFFAGICPDESALLLALASLEA